jgi:4-carboxymuconolactone decarboxylase
MGDAMPRVAPIKDKSELPAEHQATADAVVKFYGQIRGPWTMLLHSPKLAAQLLPMVHFFHDQSIVEGKLRSVAVLAAVREHGSAYVWSAQVAAARRNGVREELIDLIRAQGEPGKLPAPEREIMTYARQLARTNRVDQATFDALKNRYGTQWLVELTACMGYFALVSGIANAFEVPAPPDGDRLA